MEKDSYDVLLFVFWACLMYDSVLGQYLIFILPILLQSIFGGKVQFVFDDVIKLVAEEK